DVLTEIQLAFVASHLPEPANVLGRPAYTNRQLLPGILRVLRSGCRWRDLDLPGYPSGGTHWPRLKFWRRKQQLALLFRPLLKTFIFSQNSVNLSRVSLDATLIPSYGFKDTTGYSGKHHRIGVKVSTIVDREGLPLGVRVGKGNQHDSLLAEKTVRRFPGS